MDEMEDSGIDSDQQKTHNGRTNGSAKNASVRFTPVPLHTSDASETSPAANNSRKAAQLQKKIARQREAARTSTGEMNNRKSAILSRNRLPVPTKMDAVMSSSDMQPLVMLETDESEDEFSVPGLSREAHREITQQLIKDGYNLDLEPDDEDLDLIPPRPLNERCACCPGANLPAGCVMM